jgi:hypothetical protein
MIGVSQRHCPAEHVSPPVHVAHAMPAVPQALGVCEAYGMQVVPSQQPFGHEVALHTHVPEEQTWPLGQEAELQAHVPEEPQL